MVVLKTNPNLSIVIKSWLLFSHDYYLVTCLRKKSATIVCYSVQVRKILDFLRTRGFHNTTLTSKNFPLNSKDFVDIFNFMYSFLGRQIMMICKFALIFLAFCTLMLCSLNFDSRMCILEILFYSLTQTIFRLCIDAFIAYKSIQHISSTNSVFVSRKLNVDIIIAQRRHKFINCICWCSI